MTALLTLNVQGADAPDALRQLKDFAFGLVGQGARPAAEPAVVPEAAEVSSNDLHNPPPAQEEVASPKKPRGGKRAAAPETIEGTARQVGTSAEQVDVEDVAGKPQQPANENAGERLLTVDEVRELTRQWAKDGFMDEVAAEMVARNIKKMSEVDPEAGSNASAKFGAYATAIEKRIADKKAAV